MPARSQPLAELTWPEAESAAGQTLLAVPVGATEQHGPHLPLGTDTEIAAGLAAGLSRERPHVVVAPAVAYGSSGEHSAFAGTLSIGQEATELLLVELCRSAADTFVARCSSPLTAATPSRSTAHWPRLLAEGHDVRAFFPGWSHDAHAGRMETSLMLALAPARVQLARAQPGVTAPLHELLPQLTVSGVREVSPNGVLGDPAGASAREGRSLLRRGIEALVSLIDAWEGQTRRAGCD